MTENNHLSQSKNKMNGCLKAFLIFISVSFILGILGFFFGDGNIEDKKESEIKANPVIEKLQTKNYSELTMDEKKMLLDAFLKREGQFEAPLFHLNERINKTILLMSKFPETVEIKGFDGEFHKDYETHTSINKNNVQNINYDKGTFELVREFKSENSIGMKVRNRILFKLKFNSFSATIEDVKIE